MSKRPQARHRVEAAPRNTEKKPFTTIVMGHGTDSTLFKALADCFKSLAINAEIKIAKA